jgi:parallel beta-helix repeat protein
MVSWLWLFSLVQGILTFKKDKFLSWMVHGSQLVLNKNCTEPIKIANMDSVSLRGVDSPVIDLSKWYSVGESYKEGEEIKYVFVDGVKYNFSHFPVGLNEYFVLEEDQPEDFIIPLPTTLSSMLFLEKWGVLNSTFIIKSSYFSFSADKIYKVLDDFSLVIGSLARYPPYKKEYGFKFINTKEMLSPGTFYYDKGEKALYIRPIKGEYKDVRYVTDDKAMGISIINSTNVTIEGIRIDYAGVLVKNSDGITIKNIVVNNAGQVGISVFSSANVRILNCTIRSPARVGVLLKGRGIKNITVYNSTIEDVFRYGYLQSYQPPGSSFLGAGILVYCDDNCKIVRNRIVNAGYSGITLNYANNCVIRENFIKESCLVLDDCGAILTSYSAFTTIEGNLVVGVRGNGNGLPKNLRLARGIYLDIYSYNFTVVNNTVLDVTSDGIFLNSPKSVRVRRNLVYSVSGCALTLNEYLNVKIEDVVAENNVLVSSSEKCFLPSNINKGVGVNYYYYNELDHGVSRRTGLRFKGINRTLVYTSCGVVTKNLTDEKDAVIINLAPLSGVMVIELLDGKTTAGNQATIWLLLGIFVVFFIICTYAILSLSVVLEKGLK